VVWLAHEPLPGAREAIADLRRAGKRVVFVTNNAAATLAEQEQALVGVGVAAKGDVATSAQAAARLVEPGERVLVGGAAGLFEAVADRGAEPFDPPDWVAAGRTAVDAVVVGLHRTFDYARLDALSNAVRRGARFIASNTDATYPTPDGPVPGGGALVAAVATAAGVQPVIAGKPHRPMAELVAERCGERFAPERALMVGDRWSTDGAFAAALGCAFAQVRSGVTVPGEMLDGHAALDLPDLAAVAELLLR